MSSKWQLTGEIENDMEVAAKEGVGFLVKAFRGSVSLDDKENRALLSAATATLGAYTRNRATTSAMEQTRIVRARLLADPSTGAAVAGLLGEGEE